jgi:glycosyltransferase involved in cell wall biosynthesis
MKLSIVIPCYNEARNIPLVLEGFKKAISRTDMELIVVDNGSTDHTQTVLKEILPQYLFARMVKVEINQGYGFGILSGLKSAQGEYIGWTHADCQTDPQDVIKAFELIEKQGNSRDIFVKGNRRGRPLFDQVFTIGMSFFESLLLGQRLWDINAQPNILHRSFFETWRNPPNDFALDLYALYLARRKKLNIFRFSVVFPPRIYGASHWNTGLKAKWKFIKRTVDFSFSLRKRLVL